ncbi:hypothetical protein [Shewanella donghaensis]|uniref:hypothetical protein n=1 Tax=Shewanella donghaensis TaxID=238836 RepID=UPI001182905C|nr:hypothetical protein [Shewanella donghaensis]
MKDSSATIHLDLTSKNVSKFISQIPPGTIGFTRTKLGLNSSTFIQAGQGSIWSHVFMCIDKGDIIETDLKNGAQIVPLTKALKGVHEVEFLVPIKPIQNISKLREIAEQIVNSENASSEYGKSAIVAAGIFPIAKLYSWVLTGGLTLLTMAGLSSAPPLTLLSMAFGSSIFSVIEKYFGTQEKTIERMAKLYNGLKLTNTKIGEKLSDEDHKFICSTLVQKMLEYSDSEFKNPNLLARPKDLNKAIDKSDNYNKTRVKLKTEK